MDEKKPELPPKKEHSLNPCLIDLENFIFNRNIECASGKSGLTKTDASETQGKSVSLHNNKFSNISNSAALADLSKNSPEAHNIENEWTEIVPEAHNIENEWTEVVLTIEISAVEKLKFLLKNCSSSFTREMQKFTMKERLCLKSERIFNIINEHMNAIEKHIPGFKSQWNANKNNNENGDNNALLRKAIEINDMHYVDFSLNYCQIIFQQAFYYAVFYGNIPTLERLQSNKCIDPAIDDNEYLEIAVGKGALNVIEFLWKDERVAKTVSVEKLTALIHKANDNQQSDVVHLLSTKLPNDATVDILCSDPNLNTDNPVNPPPDKIEYFFKRIRNPSSGRLPEQANHVEEGNSSEGYLPVYSNGQM